MRVIALALFALLAGCASTSPAEYRPLVDLAATGHRIDQYELDLMVCQDFASQVPSASQQAVAGAVVGAVFGAALGTAIGDSSDFAGAGARGGALGGALGGAGAGAQTQQDVIRRCMAGRGYSVLN